MIAGEGALDDVIFRVIAWAEAQGRLAALVNGARVEVPGNPQLIAFERTIVEARDARPQDVPLRQFAERVQLAPSVPDEPDSWRSGSSGPASRTSRNGARASGRRSWRCAASSRPRGGHWAPASLWGQTS